VEALLDNFPIPTIQAERGAGVLINVNQGSVLDSCLFKSKRLPSGASAEFHGCQSAFLGRRSTGFCPRSCEPWVFSPPSRFLREKTSRGRETPFHFPSSFYGLIISFPGPAPRWKKYTPNAPAQIGIL